MYTVTRYDIPSVLSARERRPACPRVCTYVCGARAVGCRVRDRACACTDALHNIFAIVKCKAPARGSPAEPAFPRAAFAHCAAPQFRVRGREEREMGRRRLESKFLSSHVNRDVARAIEALSTYFYIPFERGNLPSLRSLVGARGKTS